MDTYNPFTGNPFVEDCDFFIDFNPRALQRKKEKECVLNYSTQWSDKNQDQSFLIKPVCRIPSVCGRKTERRENEMYKSLSKPVSGLQEIPPGRNNPFTGNPFV